MKTVPVLVLASILAVGLALFCQSIYPSGYCL